MFQEIVMIDYRKSLHHRREMRRFAGPYRWSPAKPGTGRAFYARGGGAGLAVDEAGSTFRLRLEFAREYVNGHRWPRWYNDGADGRYYPIIARLPHGRGFLAGWTMGGGMLSVLDADIYDTETEAALAAHHIAERDAELEREAMEAEAAREREAEEAALAATGVIHG